MIYPEKRKIKIYNTISEFFRSLDLEIIQHLDFTIHSLEGLHGSTPMSAPYFRTNYYVFLLIEGGASHYTIDGRWFPLRPYSFYFTNPGHLKTFTIERELKGYMLTFSEGFLKANYPGNVEWYFPFLFEETVPVMYLPQDIYYRMSGLCEILAREYQTASAYQEKIIANHLAALLFLTKELLLTYQVKLTAVSRPAEIARLFKAALNRNFQHILRSREDHIWDIQEYAAHLHIHPNHLSNTIKRETGKTVKQWVNEKIIAEARIMLKHSSMTVAEIAYALTFRDVSNFSRFFRNNTGQTPSEYRAS